MLEMQLDSQVQCAITQDELFSSSCLPEFIQVVTNHMITLKSLFVELPKEWPFEDQILSWLVPNLKDNIRKFHSDSGPGLPELYDDFIINKYDLMLKEQLLSILYEAICTSGETTYEDNITFGKVVLSSTTTPRIKRKFSRGCVVDETHYDSANEAVEALISGGKLELSDIPRSSYNANDWLNKNSKKFNYNYRRDV